MHVDDAEMTGDAAVDEALRTLAGLDEWPVHEHGPVIEHVHQALQDRLAEEPSAGEAGTDQEPSNGKARIAERPTTGDAGMDQRPSAGDAAVGGDLGADTPVTEGPAAGPPPDAADVGYPDERPG